MIHIILIVAMGFLCSIVLWRSHRKQDLEIRRVYMEPLISAGVRNFYFNCRYCSKLFTHPPAVEAECPNCRGLVRIRLPRE